MMTALEMVMALRERVAALEGEIAAMKMGLGHLLPQPTVPTSSYDPHAPRPTEPTTVNREVHPSFSNAPKESQTPSFDTARHVPSPNRLS